MEYVSAYVTDVGRDSLGGIDLLQARRSRDRIQLGASFSAPVQTVHGADSASCTIDAGFLSLRGEVSGAWR
jgi:hypothetical protein